MRHVDNVPGPKQALLEDICGALDNLEPLDTEEIHQGKVLYVKIYRPALLWDCVRVFWFLSIFFFFFNNMDSSLCSVSMQQFLE